MDKKLSAPLLGGLEGGGMGGGGGGGAHTGMSMLEVCFMQTAIILGLGVLGLSFALGTMGWALGLLILGLSAAGAVYSGLLIAAIVEHLSGGGRRPGQPPPRKYSDLGFAAWGPRGRVLVRNVQYTFLGGALVAVQLTASKALVEVAGAAGGEGSLCLWVANVLVALAMLPIMQKQQLSDVSWTAFLGVAMIMLPVALFLSVVATHAADAGSGAAPTSVGFPSASSGFDRFSNGMTTLVFAFQGQTIFPELISQMARPAEFPRAVRLSVGFMATVYVAVGCYGYSLLGAGATYLVDFVDGLQDVRGADQRRIAAANAMLMVNVMMGYTINGNVMNHALADRFLGDGGGSGGGGGAAAAVRPKPAWLAITCTTLTVSFLLSNVIPNLGSLLSVLGATCGYTLTFLFPAGIALKLLRGSMTPAQVLLHQAVIASAALAVAIGTYATLKNLVEQSEASGVFTC